MSEILPDLPGAPSGWDTDNHYFYEIVNHSGNSVRINFVISSENITETFREICDRIETLYPTRSRNRDWMWRTHFSASSVPVGEEISKDEIFSGLDTCLEEIRQFEAELKEKL